MFEDGIYEHKAILVIVIDGIGMEYSMNWHGDFAEWEVWKKEDTETDTSYFDTVEDMFAGVCGFHWVPEPDSVDFYPVEEIDFDMDEFPPVSYSHPEWNTATYSSGDTPVLEWAMSQGIIL